ncbi:MAG: 1-acyl-sn-glycerol-3-phosphate acyltransferase [Leptolyngbyaceae cyanobacterium RM1_1_2]|nr:1-acyl-sn-glycerol-3-phosphate acyltransferase [Leptolyngbyaceae cyanobacterium RM1_1_2]
MSSVPPRAQPPLKFIEPRFNPAVLQGMRYLMPLWMRGQTDLIQIQAENTDGLVKAYQQFQSGQTRLLIAFRHPSPEDAFCLAHLMWYLLPQRARQLDAAIAGLPHIHFIYDRGIPLWAGQWLGWLYSRLGGTPIQRGKVDIAGLRSARHLFASGQFPMAAAPEGANNGHTEIVSPLEPGIAQLGFWCVEDLRKANRDEAVIIIPLGIKYRYLKAPWQTVEQLLTQLEAECGLSQPPELAQVQQLKAQLAKSSHLPPQTATLYARLLRLGEHLLSLMENYYREFYHMALLPAETELSPAETTDGFNIRLAQRLDRLLKAALTVAETYFNLVPKGSLIDRCRRLEQAGWDWIYRDELRPSQSLSAVERGLADRIAEEASLRMWHMRLVESFVAVTGRYFLEKPTVERFAETVLLLRDTIARIQGRNPFPRLQLGQQAVKMTVGEPISVSDRAPAYRHSRRQAVADLTQDLQAALEGLIASE